MEDMVVYFCSQSAYQLYMKNRKVVMVVAGRGCKRKCRRRREKSSVLRRSLENCGRTTSRQLRWQEASIALLCFAVRFSGLVQSIDTVDSILFILSHPSHYSPSSRPLPPPVPAPDTTTKMTTPDSQQQQQQQQEPQRPKIRYNLRNPLPLSASQEAEVQDLFHKRVRRHCAAEVKGKQAHPLRHSLPLYLFFFDEFLAN